MERLPCSLCGLTFKSKDSLRGHVKRHKSDSEKIHNLMTSKSKSMHHSGKNSNGNLDRDDNKICQCGKYFKSPSGLRLHKAFECQANSRGSLDDQSNTSDGIEAASIADDSVDDGESGSSNDPDVLSSESDSIKGQTNVETDEENHEKIPLKKKRQVKHKRSKYMKVKRSKKYKAKVMEPVSDLSNSESESSIETDGENNEKIPLKKKRQVKHKRSKYVKVKRSKKSKAKVMETDSDLSNSESESSIETDGESIVSNSRRIKSKASVKEKIWMNHAALSPENIEKGSKGFNCINCIGIEEYLNVFELMQDNRIDEILNNDVYTRVLHSLFNGLKEGWIPICGPQIIKLGLHLQPNEADGKRMFGLINKFKDGISKDKLKDMISTNRSLVLHTFDQFRKSILNYIELYQDCMNHIITKLEKEKDSLDGHLKRKND